ncbi:MULTISPECIES: competence/damage-inducible protein A [unclassified Sphingobacterium]|uniref:competence/damage-inducible protein A n=1 Tax=unclassified Sphingobacterium TaxID=2609468 RepID=UPI0025F197B5|nr:MULTISPECIES: competence/damage-inducible protein A [unclassified Sphingobacterium]
MTAEIITIGDEILIGQIIDTNSAWIAKQLKNINISIGQITSISDSKEAIRQTLQEAAGRADIIIVTGGLGPTKDDITKITAADYFGTHLIRDEKVLAHVEDFFKQRGLEMLEINLQQADILANSEVLFNDVGTAPGMFVRQDNKYYFFMPGVPFEMKFIVTNRILPILSTLDIGQSIWTQNIITAGIGESFLANNIADIEDALPDYIKLAYLPKYGSVRMRLTAIGQDASALRQQTEEFANRIVDRALPHVISTEDLTIEEVIIKEFAKRNLTLSTAESCTGGFLAAQLTAVPGCSQIFTGGTIPYSNKLKMQLLGVTEATLSSFGAVSEQTVIEMANGSKKNFDTDYAIATSGIAGPDGGTPEKPVGTVWIAIAGKEKVITKKCQFTPNRQVNIELATAYAYNMLWNLFHTENNFTVK